MILAQHNKTMENNNLTGLLWNQNDKPLVTKKSVSFAPTALCRQTLHINNYTKREVSACWFGKKELSQIRKDIIRTVQKMEAYPDGNIDFNLSTDLDEESYCTRGLEKLTKSASEAKFQERKRISSLVLQEYREQIDEKSMVNEYLIAAIYCDHSLKSKSHARFVGLADQNFVQSILHTESPSIAYSEEKDSDRKLNTNACLAGQSIYPSPLQAESQLQVMCSRAA